VAPVLRLVLALLLAPLLPGIITRTKAFFAGRRGAPLLQPYRDLGKLLGKGAVYSRTTTWVFRAGPIVGLAALLLATSIVPCAGEKSLVSFPGDLVLFAGLLGLARLLTVLAALDTGSSFEGMGASREVLVSALAEPALLVSLLAVARMTGELSLGGMVAGVSAHWATAGPVLALVVATLVVVYLAENARIPVDDPTTHLELTMIHEVMVLDHGGPDLAFILYASALKLWVLGALVVSLLVPVRSGIPLLDAAAFAAGMAGLAVVTGVVESSMARLRLSWVPQLLVGAAALSALALVLVLWVTP
jgi:formate hydrogenlyase subunit 4